MLLPSSFENEEFQENYFKKMFWRNEFQVEIENFSKVVIKNQKLIRNFTSEKFQKEIAILIKINQLENKAISEQEFLDFIIAKIKEKSVLLRTVLFKILCIEEKIKTARMDEHNSSQLSSSQNSQNQGRIKKRI